MTKKLFITSATTLALMATVAVQPASAGENEDLQRQINDLQTQLKTLTNKVKNQHSSSKTNDVKIDFIPSPKITSADGNNSFKVGGRVQADAAFFSDDKVDHPDGTTFRRARLGVSGKAGADWKYKLEADFANNDTKLTDAYIRYTGLDGATITAGQFKEPFSLENLTSSRFITFLERASINSFSPDRNIGLAATSNGSNWTASLGVFGESAGDSGSDDEGWSTTGRLTYAPIVNNDLKVHLGVAGSYRTPDRSTDSVRYNTRPDTGLASAKSIDTGTISDVDNVTLLGLEAAVLAGSFSVQAEYASADVDTDGSNSPRFDGGYVQASYFLTGESRHYSAKKSIFGRVKPAHPLNLKTGDIGAWEIAARVSTLSLTDGPISGGEMDTATVGLNWYPSDYTRVMLNYTSVDTDSNATTVDDDPQIVAARFQLDF